MPFQQLTIHGTASRILNVIHSKYYRTSMERTKEVQVARLRTCTEKRIVDQLTKVTGRMELYRKIGRRETEELRNAVQTLPLLGVLGLRLCLRSAQPQRFRLGDVASLLAAVS